MELYVVGYGSGCVIANDRLQTWNGKSWGDLESARLFPSRSSAYAELQQIESTLRQSTMKTVVNRVGPDEFPRYVIVTEEDEFWNGESFGHVRSALIYAHRDLAEQDAARIEAERSDFFHGE